ncbi:MAG TPA: LCP family protein, partial [Pseudonocardiaceae bacterium]
PGGPARRTAVPGGRVPAVPAATPLWPGRDQDDADPDADTVVDLPRVRARNRRALEPEPGPADNLDVGDDTDDTDEDRPPRRSTARRVLIGARRGLAGLLSLAVLAGTGYGWSSLHTLQKNLNTTNVISAVPQDTPSDGATDILLVGSDSRTDANGVPLPLEVLKLLRTEESAGLNTDTIILIRVPEDGGNAYAVSIPRDTYVPIPGYRDDRINAAYGVTKRTEAEKLRASGMTDDAAVDRQAAAAGQRVLVQVVEALTGARIDHYAEINLYGFYLLTQAIGGVEVCLKRGTKDPDSGADFDKGRQVISGGDALAFVRQRKNLPRGDLDRIVRQQVFMAALANRMLAAGTLADPGKLSGLLDAAQKSVILDEGWDVLGFAAQLQGLAGGDVEFVTIPVVEVGFINERGQNVITVDPAAVRAFMTGLLNDTPPSDDVAAAPPATTSAGPATPTPTTPVGSDSVIITVRNGTNNSGLAGRVLDELAERGFRTGQPDNASRRENSEVRVAPAARAVGDQIATILGGISVVEDPGYAPETIRVTLGADYTGPGLQGLAAGPLVHLDGRPFPAQPPTDDDAPITAEGITCVN